MSELSKTSLGADDLEALAKRLANSIQREVSAQSGNHLLIRAALRASDAEALSLVVLGALEKSEVEPNARARIALKGAIRFNGLVADSGGTYSVRETANLLGRTPDSIRKGIARNQLLAFKRSGEWMLPVAQFDLEKRESLSGLRELLGALADHDAHSQMIFCLSNYEAMKMSPLELLRAGFELSALCSGARKYLEQNV